MVTKQNPSEGETSPSWYKVIGAQEDKIPQKRGTDKGNPDAGH